MLNNIRALFEPENIAVIGASNDPHKAGNVVIKNLLRRKYPKKIFPINPNEDEIFGLKVYKTLSEIEEKVELVVLLTPSHTINSVMEDLEKRMQDKNDVKALVCAASNYSETKTQEGIEREKILIETTRKHRIRVVGPNCIGVIDNYSGVDTTFVETGLAEELIKKGGISFISQSGAIATSILMLADSYPVAIGFNKVVSIGNMADVDFIDLLEYLEEDDKTKVIGLYLEGYPEARKLVETLERIVRKKPVVVLKVGRSEIGARAAQSHTGSLAGSDRVYDSAFKQNGIIRVDTLEELLDTMKAFDSLPLPRDGNTFILTQAGGPGIYCTDALDALPELSMPVVSQRTRTELKKIVPPMSSICEPEGYVDITAAALADEHVNALRIVLEDDKVASVILITIVPTFLSQEKLGRGLADLLSSNEFAKQKPVFITIMAGDYVRPARQLIENSGIYTYDTPDRAVIANKNMVNYVRFLQRKSEEDKICGG